MPIYSTDGATVSNSRGLTSTVTISGDNVRFTNTATGSIAAQLVLSGNGIVVENLAGGYIGAPIGANPFTFVAITGSQFDDTILNSGTIMGLIQLGGGNDVFRSLGGTGTYANTVHGVDLGDGDDLLELSGGSVASFPHATGGAGWDTLELGPTTGLVNGNNLIGFEQLRLTTGGNYVGFSGYYDIRAADTPGAELFNLVDCFNSDATLYLGGKQWTLARVSLQFITGSLGDDSVQVNFGASIASQAHLSDGNDSIGFGNGATVRNFAPQLIGGEGQDYLTYSLSTSGLRDDLDRAFDFETLYVSNISGGQASISLANLRDFSVIKLESGVKLTIRSAWETGFQIQGAQGGSVTIANGVTAGGFLYSLYGIPTDGGTEALPNLLNSITLTNNGAILGEVVFGGGNDVYIGTVGSVGGTVSGNTGNDTMRGGAGVDRFDGEGGADMLYGGGNADVLTGGSGDDFLRGEAGADALDGGTGKDSLFGSTGKDTLTGGADRDVFYFLALADSYIGTANADVITDFEKGIDKIVLKAIDAIAATEGDDACTFIGKAAFSHTAGELRYRFDGNGNTHIQLDVNGDGVADLSILLTGQITLLASDFVL